jgi:hypothetical protein
VRGPRAARLLLAAAAALALACGIKAAPRPPLTSKPGGKVEAPAAQPSPPPGDCTDCTEPSPERKP